MLPFATAEDQKDLKKTLDLMSEHYVGKVNTIFERFKFHQRAQRAQEGDEDYITALCTLAETCDFKNAKPNDIIRGRIVCGIRNTALRQALLQKHDLTLQQCIDAC